MLALAAGSRVPPPPVPAAHLNVSIGAPSPVSREPVAAAGAQPPLRFQAAYADVDAGRHGATALPVPVALEYLPAEALDRRPVLQGDIDIYPSFLGTYPGEGVVVLALFIGATGRVDKMEVESSNLPPVFAETALDAFRRATFTPGEKDGQSANTRVRIEITYAYLHRQ